MTKTAPPRRPERPDSAVDPVDLHVGARIRMRRRFIGMSQQSLADTLGLTFQQVQKYERGANRIGASRMYDLAHVLDVPVSFFFEDMPDDVKQRDAAPIAVPDEEETAGAEPNPLNRRETLELVRAYYRIQSARVRKRMFELVKAVARVEDAE